MEVWDIALVHLMSLLKLLAAATLGGLIGFERERHDQPAGLRTHIILCVGAALITMISLEIGNAHGGDRSRIAAQIVSGIGFLGAGAILKYGTTVRGLTTATSLWTVAGIGMAAGFALWVPAVIATAIVYTGMAYLRRVEGTLFAGRTFKSITITARDTKGLIAQVENLLEDHNVIVSKLEVSNLLIEKKIQLHIYARTPRNIDLSKLRVDMARIEGVTEFEIA